MHPIISICIMIILATLPVHAGADSEIAPSILSIIPGQSPPGNTVVISGSGFTSESSVFLGIDEIPLKTISSRQISFEIPQIPAGNYALYIRQKSGAASKAYAFTVTSLKPSVSGIHPDTVSLCASAGNRQIIVRGKNFQEGARLLFDGAIIKGSRTSAEEMAFQAPQVPAGIHQIQVKNPDEGVSSAIALLIASQPEIRNVTQGNDYVNYYELNIEGINFQQGSTLIVEGRRIQSGQPNPGDRDRLVFRSCTSLTYQRYPYDPSIKSFEMVVVNPNGEESSLFTVSAP